MLTGALLAGVSTVHVLGLQQQTIDARTPRPSEGTDPSAVRVGEFDTRWRDASIHRSVIVGGGAHPRSHPPGLSRAPRAGEVFVSPALSQALTRHSELRRLTVGQTVVGLIRREGLRSPGELRMVQGVTSDPTSRSALRPVAGFGMSSSERLLDWTGRAAFALPLLVLVVGVPIGVCLVVASRLMLIEDERRRAALSALGIPKIGLQIATVCELLPAVLIGIGLGLGWFLLAWSTSTHLPMTNLRYWAVDTHLGPLTTGLVTAGSVAAALVIATSTSPSRKVISTRPTLTTRIARPWHTFTFLGGFSLLIASSIPGRDAGMLAEVGIVIACVLLMLGFAPFFRFILSELAKRLVKRAGTGGLLIGARWLPDHRSGAFRLAIAFATAFMVLGFVAPFAASLEGGSFRAETQLESAHGYNLTLTSTRLTASNILRQTPAKGAIQIEQAIDASGISLPIVVATCSDLAKIVSVHHCSGSVQWLTDVDGPSPTAHRVGITFPIHVPTDRLRLRNQPTDAVKADLGYFPALRVDPEILRKLDQPGGSAFLVNLRNGRDDLTRFELVLAGLDPSADYANAYADVIDRSHRNLALLQALLIGTAVAGAALLIGLGCSTIRLTRQRATQTRVLGTIGAPSHVRAHAHVIGAGLPLILATVIAGLAVSSVWWSISHIDPQTTLPAGATSALLLLPTAALILIFILTMPASLIRHEGAMDHSP